MLALVSLADAAAAATAFGVFFAAWALFLQRGQERTQFEDSIVQQYRELMKPELLANASVSGFLDDLPESERKRLRQIYLYLDLCNEQVFLRAIGRVSRSTWKVQWSQGIGANLRGDTAIAAAWRLIKENTDDFHELRAFEWNDWRDPRYWEPLWRRTFIRFGLTTLRVPYRPP